MLWLAAVSIFGLADPCGAWQVAQPSAFTAGCSWVKGPASPVWHRVQAAFCSAIDGALRAEAGASRCSRTCAASTVWQLAHETSVPDVACGCSAELLHDFAVTGRTVLGIVGLRSPTLRERGGRATHRKPRTCRQAHENQKTRDAGRSTHAHSPRA